MRSTGVPTDWTCSAASIMEAPDWLRSGGVLIMETSRAQASATAQLLIEQGFSVRISRDSEVDATVAVAVANRLPRAIPAFAREGSRADAGFARENHEKAGD